MADQLIQLVGQHVRLDISPWMGGGVTAFSWKGRDVFRRYKGCSPDPLSLASFAMLPFCNRMAYGEFTYGGTSKTLPPTHVAAEPEHALHGLGWISPWGVTRCTDQMATVHLHHDGSLWPWAFQADQHFTLFENGYGHGLELTNLADVPMPAGIGLHPYFPAQSARLYLDVSGFWQTGADRLPSHHLPMPDAAPWLLDQTVDHCFTGRRGPITIDWPTHRLTLLPSPELGFAHVYCPRGEDYFCVEPVSHMPDAINRAASTQDAGLRWLAPGETLTVSCNFLLEDMG